MLIGASTARAQVQARAAATACGANGSVEVKSSFIVAIWQQTLVVAFGKLFCGTRGRCALKA